MSTNSPLVTVLMPVYNGARYLGEAIESILNQTYTNFEFLIIDDASTDDSVEIIKSYRDSRLRFVENSENLGQAETMNRGLRLALSQYIARMDQDDISLSLRLEKQVGFMENNPQVGVCGTWMKYIGYGNSVLELATKDDLIKIKLLTTQNLAHPTVMIRNSVLNEYNLRYNGEYSPAEDYDLWVRMSDYCSFANLPEPLVKYRLHENQGSKIAEKRQSGSSNRVRRRLIESMKVHLENNDLLIHNKVFCGEDTDSLTVGEVFSYLMRLHCANRQSNIFEPVAFDEFIRSNWERFIIDLNLRIRSKIPRFMFLPRTSFWNARDRVNLLSSYFHLFI